MGCGALQSVGIEGTKGVRLDGFLAQLGSSCSQLSKLSLTDRCVSDSGIEAMAEADGQKARTSRRGTRNTRASKVKEIP